MHLTSVASNFIPEYKMRPGCHNYRDDMYHRGYVYQILIAFRLPCKPLCGLLALVIFEPHYNRKINGRILLVLEANNATSRYAIQRHFCIGGPKEVIRCYGGRELNPGGVGGGSQMAPPRIPPQIKDPPWITTVLLGG